jgi:hypothetical protein
MNRDPDDLVVVDPPVAATRAAHVFASSDPFVRPFADAVAFRQVIYPVAWTAPREVLSELFESARASGQTCAYVRYTEGFEEAREQRPHAWQIPLLSSAYLAAVTEPLEHQVVSAKGDWGLWMTHLDLALLGASRWVGQGFSETLKLDWRRQVVALIRDLADDQARFGATYDWTPALLHHLFGPEQAEQLASEAGVNLQRFATSGT